MIFKTFVSAVRKYSPNLNSDLGLFYAFFSPYILFLENNGYFCNNLVTYS